MLTTNQIRTQFLEFFRSKGHSVIPSDTLVPKDDPTVLFTTAGMQQFKRQFLGHIEGYTRAATSQKCLRTDDLDQVGKTAFHHTFFEMLGNFSFGDYFKSDAIAWAWEFLTQQMGIPPEKLWVSVYLDDQEAEKIWLQQIKIPPHRLVRLGDKSNFWPSEAKEKGPNGPCGPCSEIFFDYGKNPTCPKGEKCDPDCNCGRFAEIWNLVFTQFNRKDGGILEPLPAKNIDTGMGLERLAAVVQGKKSNFETDIFTPILAAITSQIESGKINIPQQEKHIIADHLRAIVIAINDGVVPSNKERGFVVKGLINSATNIALSHGATEPTIYRLVPSVAEIFHEPYPEISSKSKDIADIVRKIEEAFILVRRQRIPELLTEIPKAKSSAERGEIYFRYRDTYGLPLNAIVDAAQQTGIEPATLDEDMKYFANLMEEQKTRSRASSKMTGDVFVGTELDLKGIKTTFLGYEQSQVNSRILKIFKNNQDVAQAHKGDLVKIVLDPTPFYAESGGQVGDKGTIHCPTGNVRIDDTQKIGEAFLHVGVVIDGVVTKTSEVMAAVDEKRRGDIMRNHTATHLLQSALRTMIGPHVQQQGSEVDEERLRFDFTHPKALTPPQILAIEDYVYQAILDCRTVVKENISLEEAKDRGALAFFAEKYGDTVRMVSIDGYSKELCGGTHLHSTGQIGLFKIISESAIAQGIRRIEAKTGWGALAWMNARTGQLENLCQSLKVPEEELASRVLSLTNRVRQLEKDVENYRFHSIKSEIKDIFEKADTVNSVKIIPAYFENVDINTLRKISDLLKQQAKTAVAILGSTFDANAFILVTVTEDLVKRGVDANKFISQIAPLIGGSGGGRPNMAQAGSKEVANVKEAIAQAKEIITQRIQSI